jgi:hypothetical protein
MVVRSADGGGTWEGLPGINDGDVDDAIQPTIMIHADGRLQMLSRNKGLIPTTWSDDNGETWTTLKKTVLPANGSGVDAVTLRDGRQLLAYNHVPTPEGKKGNRHFLNLAVSNDGENWSAGLVLGICDDGQFSYPAIIQGRDGLVHITHTWHRKTIAHIVVNPYKITDETIVPMPNGKWPSSGPLSKQENQYKRDDPNLTSTPDSINIIVKTAEITASILPANSGIVDGAGVYKSGQTVELTATANPDYEFSNWTINGSVVSNNRVYSFEVTQDTTLVANFKEIGTEIKNIDSDYKIQLFPNPTSDYIRIELVDNQIQKIRLYSLTGGNLITENIDQKSLDINISDLINGIYILEIESDDNKVFKQKILKE